MTDATSGTEGMTMGTPARSPRSHFGEALSDGDVHNVIANVIANLLAPSAGDPAR